MAVEIVLQKNVDKLGKSGEIKKVSEGYARNFLLVFGYAKLATPEAIKEAEKIKEKRLEEEKKEMEKMEKMASKFDNIKLIIKKKEEKGKLFGSVSSTDISDSLKEKKLEINKDLIEIDAGIKEVGKYKAKIKFTPEIVKEIEFEVKGSQEKKK